MGPQKTKTRLEARGSHSRPSHSYPQGRTPPHGHSPLLGAVKREKRASGLFTGCCLCLTQVLGSLLIPIPSSWEAVEGPHSGEGPERPKYPPTLHRQCRALVTLTSLSVPQDPRFPASWHPCPLEGPARSGAQRGAPAQPPVDWGWPHECPTRIASAGWRVSAACVWLGPAHRL